MKKKLLSIVLAAGMMVMMFAGCGGNSNSVKSDSQESSTSATDEKKDGDIKKIKLQLKWLPQSQFMGYYVAADKGYYKDEGLEVEILPGGSDIIPEQNVYNGVADVGVTWVSSLMTYQAQGYELQEVAQMFQKSGLLLVSKKDTGINSP